MNEESDITGWLSELRNGSDKAFGKLFPLVYNRLKVIAYHQMVDQTPDHTFSKTDLVHEAYLKLANQKETTWKDRAHFYSVAATAMRHILIDHARKKNAEKRGGEKNEVTFIDEIMNAHKEDSNELILLDIALSELAEFDNRMAKIVEYRYFGEMKINDIAEVLNLSSRTIKRDWVTARGWLYQRLREKA